MSAYRKLAFWVFGAGIGRLTGCLRTVRPDYGIRDLGVGSFGPFQALGRS